MKSYALVYLNEIFAGFGSEAAPRRDFAAVLRTFAARIEQRRALAGLEPRLLRDIGIDADTARDESSKRFWQD